MDTISHDESIQQEPAYGLDLFLTALASARDRFAVAQANAHQAEADVNAIRADLQAFMETTGVKTGEAHGLQVQLKTRKGQAITDEIELLAAITEAGMLDDFLRFDKSAAAKYALQHEMPGVEATATTYLNVSEVK